MYQNDDKSVRFRQFSYFSKTILVPLPLKRNCPIHFGVITKQIKDNINNKSCADVTSYPYLGIYVFQKQKKKKFCKCVCLIIAINHKDPQKQSSCLFS